MEAAEEPRHDDNIVRQKECGVKMGSDVMYAMDLEACG